MQMFDRGGTPPPAYLVGPEAAAARAAFLQWIRLEPGQRAIVPSPAGGLPLNEQSVAEALQRLFHRRCAFCEATAPVQPYRYRPPTEATPVEDPRESHLFYGWLSDAWENLYAICRDCLPGDQTRFPVDGPRAPPPGEAELMEFDARGGGLWGLVVPEVPLLLDPCGRDPADRHLRFMFDGRITGRTPPGRETVAHYNLDRRDLRRRRRIAFQAYMQTVLRVIGQAGAPLAELDFASLEFGGGWCNLLGQILRPADDGAMTPDAVAEGVRALQGDPGSRVYLLSLIRRAQQIQRGQEAAQEAEAPVPRRRAGQARLTSFRLTNFKGVEDLYLRVRAASAPTLDEDGWRPETPALLILGENAVGKSSVLEGVALALCDEDATSALRVRHRVHPRDLVLDAPQVSEGGGRKAKQAVVELNFDGGESRFLTINRRTTKAIGYDDLPPVFAYGAFRQFLRRAPSETPASPVITLFAPEQLLPDPEAWIASLDPGQFDLVLRALHDMLSYHGPFDVVEVEGDRVFLVTSEPGPDGVEVPRRQPMSVVSSGFRSVLAMVCDVMRRLMQEDGFETFANARAVVLIDEVEAHLHPRWKIRIMRGLRRALPQVTFIATTHDPLCLRGVEKEEVAVLRRTTGGDSTLGLAATVEAITDPPEIDYFTIEQLLTSDLFGLYSTEKPVTEFNFARIGDLLAVQGPGGSVAEPAALTWFRDQVAEALPLGSTEIQRVVEDAVADYLRNRRGERQQRITELRASTRARIAAALRTIGG
jgi:hypothetical protein